jgi:hypothetical protein
MDRVIGGRQIDAYYLRASIGVIAVNTPAEEGSSMA